jgi:type IV pilus assembly protein PilQ
VSDNRTSSLILTDTADVLERVERLVKELDIPPAQVMIEGKVVEATESFSRTLGVNWGFGGAPAEISSSGGFNGSPLRLNSNWSSTSISSSTAAAANGVLELNVGRFDFLGDLNATLSLAQADSLVKIVSSPRIVTMNKEKAEISQKGEVITINKTVDQNGQPQSNATRTPVELKLAVNPQITNEGSVLLDIDVLRQFAGPIADSDTKARPVESRSAKTKVLVPNGQTAVIGGIYQSTDSTTENGVPGLKDIPILGWLFKSKADERTKTELIIFLTPRILNAKDQSVTTN